jgi:hypothetical protein
MEKIVLKRLCTGVHRAGSARTKHPGRNGGPVELIRIAGNAGRAAYPTVTSDGV